LVQQYKNEGRKLNLFVLQYSSSHTLNSATCSAVPPSSFPLLQQTGIAGFFYFWPVEELAKLADEPTGYSEVASGGCAFDWNDVNCA
jgi:hypothetical protein